MPYWISDDCIGCGSCDFECSFDAIEAGKDERRTITPERCRDCGACALICPVHAISGPYPLSEFGVGANGTRLFSIH